MIPRWTTLACTECGREELATRLEEKPDAYANTFLCEACESHKKGYEQGLKEGSKARNWVGECFLRLQEAGWDEAPTYLPDVITRLLKRREEDHGIIAKMHRGFHFAVQRPMSEMRAVFYHEDRGVVVERPSGKALVWAEGGPLHLDEDVTLSSRWYAEEEVKNLLLRIETERKRTHELLSAMASASGGCPICGSTNPDEHATGCALENYDWEACRWKEK